MRRSMEEGFFECFKPHGAGEFILGIMDNISKREGSASSVSVNGDELYTKLSGAEYSHVSIQLRHYRGLDRRCEGVSGVYGLDGGLRG